MLYRKGDRVTCVNDAYPVDAQIPYKKQDISFPVKGRVYTVRETVRTYPGTFGIRLLEIQNPLFHHDLGGNEEPCFDPARFEPFAETAS